MVVRPSRSLLTIMLPAVTLALSFASPGLKNILLITIDDLRPQLNGSYGMTQMSTPNHMRGRVSAVNSIFIGSSNEIGGFESGLVAQLYNPVVSVVSGGIGTLVVVLAWSGLVPSLRTLGSLAELSAQRKKEEEAAKSAAS